MDQRSADITEEERQVAEEERSIAGLMRKLGIGTRRARTILHELGIRDKPQRTDDRNTSDKERRDYGPLWPIARSLSLSRDGNCCTYRGCGNTHCVENPLSVHHIEPWSEFPRTDEGQRQAHRLFNLTSLCQHHHAMADAGTITIDIDDVARRTYAYLLGIINS